VKANKGGVGVDEQSIEEFEQDLSGEPVQALECAQRMLREGDW
jgi:hypothetical protein